MLNRYPIDPNHVLEEYPRPQMVRASYQCLNGVWDCAISDDPSIPSWYPASIVVPFSVETTLSGVEQKLAPHQTLTYHRTFSHVLSNPQNRVLLHFDAVDHRCVIFLNHQKVGEHIGGYLPFQFDVTTVIENENDLIVQVQDPCDTQPIIRGKQSEKNHGIFYSGQSGIHQTVWLEEVPDIYIKHLVIESKPEQKCWQVRVLANQEHVPVTIQYLDGTHSVHGYSEELLSCQVPEVHLWSPEDPHLYPFTVCLGEDCVESYVGLRTFSVEHGRLCLNGKPYFHHGILDQGYWPFSLYTPPTDQAMIDDLLLVKKLGFNMVRKHGKIENLRWYHHCDQLGLLVWQDMPSGGRKPIQPVMSGPLFLPSFSIRDHHYALLGSQDASYRKEFEDTLIGMVDMLRNCTCIAMWVIFNEGWGQFDSARMLKLMESLDPSRTCDPASGWYDQGIGKVASRHVYFKAYRHTHDPLDRAIVLSEFGGYVYRCNGHDEQKKVFGYATYPDRQSFNEAFFHLYQQQILPARKQGLSASVYTQLTDVQQELNGLVSYDRLSVKLDEIVALQVAALLLGSEEL
ncbi:glycoside hydrolase family 2 protein [Sphaerochaeta sp.]|uniref:glycoside hydrolase family 2 protein n=1 Tax=Sphaerochaeta sp. TaxID=1972642 RepID=UPI002FCB104F